MEQRIIMTESASNMRAIARQMLKGKWKVAALGTLVYFAAVYVPIFVIDLVLSGSAIASVLDFIYLILVGGALCLGFYSMILAIQRGKTPTVSHVFSGFEQFGRAFCVYILMQIFIFLWMMPYILLIVIGVVCMALANAVGILLGIVFILAAIAALILPIRASLSYSQAFFLALDNPQMSALECIRTSKSLMIGNKWKMFCLMISFIGWMALCIVPMMIITMIASFAIVMPMVMQMAQDPALMNTMATNPAAAQAMMMTNMGSSMAFIYLATFIGSVGFLWLMPYMSVAQAGFYEVITGRLAITQRIDAPLAQQAQTVQGQIAQPIQQAAPEQAASPVPQAAPEQFAPPTQPEKAVTLEKEPEVEAAKAINVELEKPDDKQE